jgi:hypothetical protein
MKIENNILEISKVMFTNKHLWEHITDEQKEQFFFIFNRYFSRKHLDLSLLLNDKGIDKVLGMDLWFSFMKDKPYPQWFWVKTKKQNQDENENLLDQIKNNNQFTKEEFDFILNHYQDEIQEEINYIKLQKNGDTRKKVVHGKSTK